MAIFTAIATAVTNALLFAGGGFLGSSAFGTFAARVIGGVVAAGVGSAVARATGLFKLPSITEAADPGVRITLSPDTNNRLPVLYGKAFTSGPIIDAAIKNSNDTMVYCIALSEKTDTGTFSVGNIYLNDARLVFSGNTVTSHVDPNGTSDTTLYSSNVRVNVYAGGNSSSDQIYPTTPTLNAYSIMPHWGAATHTANAMVYALVEIDYDPQNGLTGLPPMTFEMTNSVKNPGDVLNDYLLNTRYGASITTDDFDQASVTGTANSQMKGFCDQLVSHRNASNVSVNQERYEINGVLTTFTDVKTNIDRICQAGGTYFAFNNKTGKYTALPNREYTAAEESAALVYNDDNIISKIDITSTDLFSMYNGIEIEFADSTRKDVLNTVRIDTPSGDRNTNEPDNILTYNLDLINDNIRAERLGNIDLQQSRNATVISFMSDFSGIQTDVGDLIKVNMPLYGYSNKLFKVLRTKEVEAEGGMLSCEISAIEYVSTIYANPNTQISLPRANIDLPRIPIMPPGSLPLPVALQGNYGNLAALPSKFNSILVNEQMAELGAGTQLADSPAANTTVTSGTTYKDIIPIESYDITNSDIGDYEFSSSGALGGLLTGAYNVGFRQSVELRFSNATNTVTQSITGGGVELGNMPSTTPPPPLVANFKVSTDPTAYGYPADMKPVKANIKLQGYSDIGTSGGAPRTFGGLNYEFARITKGERE